MNKWEPTESEWDDSETEWEDSEDDDYSPRYPKRKRQKRVETYVTETRANKRRPNVPIHPFNLRSRASKPPVALCNGSIPNSQLPNSQLPPLPTTPNNFEELWSIAQDCVERGHMYKDCQRLPEIWDVLQDIHSLIGLTSVKDGLAAMILYEIRYDDIVKQRKKNDPHWKNIIITGPSGVGKTSCAELISRLLGILRKRASTEITVGSQRNMISNWHGCTQTVVEKLVETAVSKSGVLLIDEAPNLNDGRENAQPDSYSKAALETLMEMMNLYPDELVVIFAGYEEEMIQNILSINKGLQRRLQWWFRLQPYNSFELRAIFCKQLSSTGFQWNEHKTSFDAGWWESHIAQFPYFGGSVRDWVEKICIVQIKRTFGQHEKQLVDDATLSEAWDMYLMFQATAVQT